MLFSEPNPTIRQRQSYVALPSNSGIIGSLHSPWHFGKFLNGKFDPAALPSVIHEGTHHWCFFSPVGFALSLLHYRGVGTTIEFGEDRYAHQNEICAAIQDLMRYEEASRTMAPVIEGLALFAEFDVTGSSPEVCPLPLIWANALFGGEPPDTPDLDMVLTRVRELIADIRADESLIGRKIDVLLGSADAGRNPYLSGYLTVKWAWHAAAAQRSEFASADVFLVFLRNYIFCDPELVRLLLGTSHEEFRAKFASRLQHRLLQLQHNLGNLPIKPKEQLLASLENEEWQYGRQCDPGTVGVTEEEGRNGEAALASSITHLECLAKDEHRNRTVWSTIVEVMNERDSFVLDRCDVDVEVTQDGILRVNYNPQTQLFFVTGSCPVARLHGTRGIGYATMLISRTSGYPYFAICYDGEVVCGICRGSPDESEEARLRTLALGVGRTANLTECWQIYANEWVGNAKKSHGLPQDDRVHRTVFDVYMPDLDDLVSRLYRSLSFPPWMPKEQFASAVEALSQQGLAGLFPARRIRLLPVMAGWGLGRASHRHLGAFLSTLEADETLLDVLIEVNAWARSRWGADLFHVRDGKIHAISI